ncbi:MAG TPA: DUF5343 domain-containing protein [Acidimicrobiales bacterium]|nr:DUF5343 domain-containing protein [Acidimicrobiales bacterium]
MAEGKVPYVTASGNVTKVLEKIQPAATPERFTHDFLSTKLSMTGGSARPVIPFLKRTGFLGSDGAPTERYKQFRSSTKRGMAAADALRQGYKALYEVNEYAHDLDDKKLKDLIIQVTGAETGSSTVGAILGSFRALQAFASFDAVRSDDETPEDGGDDGLADGEPPAAGNEIRLPSGLSVGYTINLHLPSTSDVAVFNAIFKSLRENLLQ